MNDAPGRDLLAASAATAALGALAPRRLPTAQPASSTSLGESRARHFHLARRRHGADRTRSIRSCRGDPVKKVAGSYYDSVDTAVQGVQVCEHLKRPARPMDRVTAVRTVHHEVIDEHAAATNGCTPAGR